MNNTSTYLTPTDSLVLKGIAILCIISHNFFHLFPPITFENEMFFSYHNFTTFLAEFQLSDIINCLFSFFGFYGVYAFIFLSGYGLAKSAATKGQTLLPFIGHHILKVYALFLLCVAIFLLFHREISANILKVLSLTSNFSKNTLYMVNGPWWFFSLIIQLYLIFIPLYKIIRRRIFNIAFIISLYLLLISFLAFTDQSLVVFYANALGHLPEFSLGIFIACYEHKLPFLNRRKFNLYLFVGSLCMVLLAQIHIFFFIFSFTFSAFAFVTSLKVFRYQNKFFIFSGQLSPLLFGFNGFLYRNQFVLLAKLSDSTLIDNLSWLIWLALNYAFAYIIFKLITFFHKKFFHSKS